MLTGIAKMSELAKGTNYVAGYQLQRVRLVTAFGRPYPVYERTYYFTVRTLSQMEYVQEAR